MPALPEVPEAVPEWIRFGVYLGFLLGAIAAVWYGYRTGSRAVSPSSRDVVVSGGIIDQASADKIVAAVDRLTEAVNKAVRFTEERDRKERAEDEREEMEARIGRIVAQVVDQRLRNYPPS